MEFTSWNPKELYHFGTKGMKWGQRRFQNEDGSLTSLGRERYGAHGHRSALGTKHDLNKLDREQANAKARYDYYNSKAVRRLAKAQRSLKIAQKNGDDARVYKAKRKIAKVNNGIAKKAAGYKKLLDNSRKMTDKIISKSLKKGYSVHSRDVDRSVNKGRNYAINAAGTALGLGLGYLTKGAVAGVVANRQTVQGKHYRVRNNGLGIRTHRSRKTRIGIVPFSSKVKTNVYYHG